MLLCLLLALNRLRMHTERTCVLCPSMLMWYSLQVNRGDHKDNMCVLYCMQNSHAVVYKHVNFFENT